MDKFEEMARRLEAQSMAIPVHEYGPICALLRRASRMREALLEIRSVLDANMGDSDPSWLPPDDVLRDEEPMLYCCIVASRALSNEESSDD